MDRIKLLIVDDEPTLRRTLEVSLAKRGYEVLAAQSGEEAYDILHRADAPQLALIDWMMPGMDGVELCRRLRASPQAQYTYVIILTGKRDRQDLLEGLNSGANDYVKKPFDIDELDARLRSAHRMLAQQAELRSQANLDGLTGIFNRTAILDLLRRELAFGAREGRSLSILLIDIDQFANVNETHGDVTGDSALRHVARSIERRLRPFDSIGRYGGDEFMAVLPACALTDAIAVAERVRGNVVGEPLATATAAATLSVSIGVATAAPATCDVHDLVAAADGALRRAKNTGRNRVESASHPMIQGPRHTSQSGASDIWPPV